MALAVRKSPSILETIEADKAERIVQLSESAWPTQDLKVTAIPPTTIAGFVDFGFCMSRFLLTDIFPAESGSGAAIASVGANV